MEGGGAQVAQLHHRVAGATIGLKNNVKVGIFGGGGEGCVAGLCGLADHSFCVFSPPLCCRAQPHPLAQPGATP